MLADCIPLSSVDYAIGTNILELKCWVLGDPSNRIFPVKIAANESVGSLKEGIMEENQDEFQHVDTKNLILSKVSVSNVRGLLEKLSDVNFANKKSFIAIGYIIESLLGRT